MINYILNNQCYIAVVLLIISAIANAVRNYLKFSSKYKNTKKADFWWHVLKYGIDRPCLFFAGIFAAEDIFIYMMLLYHDFYYHAWHYSNEIMIIIGGWAFSVFSWQSIYNALKKYCIFIIYKLKKYASNKM